MPIDVHKIQKEKTQGAAQYIKLYCRTCKREHLVLKTDIDLKSELRLSKTNASFEIVSRGKIQKLCYCGITLNSNFEQSEFGIILRQSE